MADGTTAVSLRAVAEEAPRLGVDWFIGDDIGYAIGAEVPGFPGGLSGTGRAVGWELTLTEPQMVEPLLLGGV